LPGGLGFDDLWMLTRATIAADWSDPIHLGLPLNSSVHDRRPWISYDGSTILFTSGHPSSGTRPGGIGGADIWQASIDPIVDLNGDYRVDIEDLTILIEHWGQQDSMCDMGPIPMGDGIVDASDLEVLMRHWGEDSSFLAHWKLDETGGIIAYDSVLSNDAVVMGDAIWQRESGQVDGALQLDGVTSYLSAPFILDPIRQPFSAYVWVRGGQPGQTIMSQEGAMSDWLSLDAMGTLTCNLTFPLPAVTSNVVITDDHWHHIGLVSDGSGISLYVDDVQVARSDITPKLPSNGGLQVGTGKNRASGTFWSGMIDDVQVYERVVIP
jgi:hypothetical protein